MRYFIASIIAGLIVIAIWPYIKNFSIWIANRFKAKSKEIESVMKESQEEIKDE